MKKSIRLGFHTLIGWLVAVGIVLISIFPYRPATAVSWFLLAFIALPLVLSLQYVGEKALDNSWMASTGRTVRIAVGFFVVVGIGLCIIVGWQLVKPSLGTW